MTTKYKLHQFATKRFYQKLDLLVEKKVFENKRIVIFGTSKIASMMITYLAHKNVKIDYIIDNNCNAARAEIDGIEIYSPSDLLQVYQEDVIILIASSYQKEMIAQLSEMGYELDKQIVKVVDLPELMNDYSYVDRDEFNEMSKEEIKNSQLKLLDYFTNVCEQNDIYYCLGYGTLLGAIRHKGYIPWDDDIDLHVHAKDIPRLCELFKENEEVSFITFNTSNEYRDHIAILVDNSTVVDYNLFPLQCTTGVSIDIFPLYGQPSEEEECIQYYNKLKDLELAKWEYLYSSEEFINRTKELDQYLFENDKHNREYLGYMLSPYHIKDRFPASIFKDRVLTNFEGKEYYIPAGYDEYLRIIYGEYMTLPPVERRNNKRHYYKAWNWPEDGRHNLKNQLYWDKFYSSNKCTTEPSRFASYIEGIIKPDQNLVDLGCGNGRDSVFFAQKGIHVLGIDLSERSIENLTNQHSDEKNLQFVSGDFTSLDYSMFFDKVDYFYSRFTIHAITKEQQNELLSHVFQTLKTDGRLFIEVRGIHDDIFGLGEQVGRNEFIYENHYRRFIVREELEDELRLCGFEILESREEHGFAPFKEQDPMIIRIIAKK